MLYEYNEHFQGKKTTLSKIHLITRLNVLKIFAKTSEICIERSEMDVPICFLTQSLLICCFVNGNASSHY